MKLIQLTKILIANTLVVAMLPNMASAQTVTFDDGTASTAVGNFYSGLTFSANTVWANNFSLAGSTPTLGIGSSAGSSYYFYGSNTPITLSFATLASSVSIDAIDLGGNGMRIVGYDSWGNSLGYSEAFGFNAGVGNYQTITFSAAGIASVAFYQPLFGTYGDGVVLDNLSYTVASVPEPETYAMLLAGLGLLSFTAKRRKQNA